MSKIGISSKHLAIEKSLHLRSWLIVQSDLAQDLALNHILHLELYVLIQHEDTKVTLHIIL